MHILAGSLALLDRIEVTPSVPVQDDIDAVIIALRLNGGPATTAAAYEKETVAFLACVALPRRSMQLRDSHDWADSLAYLETDSQADFERLRA